MQSCLSESRMKAYGKSLIAINSLARTERCAATAIDSLTVINVKVLSLVSFFFSNFASDKNSRNVLRFMGIKGFFKKIFSPLVFCNFFAMALVGLVLAIGTWVWMDRFTRHGEGVKVPDVKGMLVSDATLALEHEGLVATVSDSSYNKSLPAGTVLEQTPAVGSVVKTERNIYLVVNTGQTPTLSLPDIADNCSLREAQAQLKSLGFRLGPVEYVPGDKDWVMAVKCRGRYVYAGERIPIDAPVVVVVGNDDSDEDYEDWDSIGGVDMDSSFTESSTMDF